MLSQYYNIVIQKSKKCKNPSIHIYAILNFTCPPGSRVGTRTHSSRNPTAPVEAAEGFFFCDFAGAVLGAGGFGGFESGEAAF